MATVFLNKISFLSKLGFVFNLTIQYNHKDAYHKEAVELEGEDIVDQKKGSVINLTKSKLTA